MHTWDKAITVVSVPASVRTLVDHGLHVTPTTTASSCAAVSSRAKATAIAAAAVAAKERLLRGAALAAFPARREVLAVALGATPVFVPCTVHAHRLELLANPVRRVCARKHTHQCRL